MLQTINNALKKRPFCRSDAWLGVIFGLKMAESYCCNGTRIHFSNDACQALQLAWATIAEKVNEDPAMKVLSQALQARSKYATGFSAVGIDADYLDEPFHRIEIKVAWLNVMEHLMSDIVRGGQLSKSMDVNWSDELKGSWIERLTKMKDCLEAQIRS